MAYPPHANSVRTRWIICILLWCGIARADDAAWTLTTADFRAQPVVLRGLDAAGLQVAAPGESAAHLVPLDQFLQIDRGSAPEPSAGQLTLYLNSGDRVIGEPRGMKKNDLLWNNPAVGELAIPLSQVLSISRAGRGRDIDRTQDAVTFANGDRVEGIVSEVTSEAVTIKPTSGDSASIPLANIGAITFAKVPSLKRGSEKGFRLRLDDGSSLIGSDLSLANEGFSLAFGKGPRRNLPVAHVLAVEQLNGPVTFLTSLSPATDVYTPLLGPTPAVAPTRSGTDVSGQPFYIGGKAYQRGIGVHSYSRLVYNLDSSYVAFRAQFGMNDNLDRGDVTVRILLDEKPVYEQKNVRPGKLWPVVVVELGTAKQLTLEVDFGQGLHTQDRLNWIEPALLKQKPAPATQPAK